MFPISSTFGPAADPVSLTLRRLFAFVDVAIYNPNEPALRGITTESKRDVLGLHGEGLDRAFAMLDEAHQDTILNALAAVPWFEDMGYDKADDLTFNGQKPGRSLSRLYFEDRFMAKGSRRFSAENTNEGVLFLLFYITLFSHPKTPRLLLADNIEAALNPELCRDLVEGLVGILKAQKPEEAKQAVVATHSPAILDGLNLNDPDQRLFIVFRDADGHTKIKRVEKKPEIKMEGQTLKMSELWMRGLLGGLPSNY